MKKTFMLVVAIGILLVGCNPKPKRADNVRLVLDWTPNTNHTGLYVALEKGYFKEANISMEIIQPPEDSTTGLVGSGGAEFGISFQDTLAPWFAKETPLPVTAVATLIQHNTSGLVSLKEKGIDTPSKLAGHTYATWDTPVEQATIKKVMADDGGNIADVTMIPSTVTDVVSALQTNIDAVWIYKGWDGIALDVAGYATNFINFADNAPELDFYTPVLIAQNDYLAKNETQAKAVLNAIKRGYEDAIADPEGAAEILIKHVPELESNRQLVTESQKWLASQYKAEVKQWGYIDVARWDRFYNWLDSNKLVEKKIEPGFGFSNAYLPS